MRKRSYLGAHLAGIFAPVPQSCTSSTLLRHKRKSAPRPATLAFNKYWGTGSYIATITIKSQSVIATLNLTTGTLDYSNQQEDITLTLSEPHMITVSEVYNEITSILLPPSEKYDIIIGLKSGLTVPLSISSAELTWDLDDINHGTGDIDYDGFKSGRSYNVNMRFEGTQIPLTNVTMTTWQDGGFISDIIIPNL